MIPYFVQAGATDVSVVIRIADSTDGTPETGVTSVTAGLSLSYRRENAAVVAISPTDLSLLTDAHTDGGLLHIGGGYYRLDLPDAAVAGGASGALVFGTVTGMVVFGVYVHLAAGPADVTVQGMNADTITGAALATDAVNEIVDAVLDELLSEHLIAGSLGERIGRIPNAAAGGNGGLPTVDANNRVAGIAGTITTLDALDTAQDSQHATTQAGVASVEADTQDIQGRLPLTLSAGRMRSDAEAISASTAAADNVEANIGNLDVASSTLATQASVNTVDTVVDAIQLKTDNLPSAIIQNAALPDFTFFMVDSSGDPATGLTVTARRKIDGGVFGTAANAVSEVGGGWYSIDIAASDHNGTVIAWEFSAAAARTRTFTIVTRSA